MTLENWLSSGWLKYEPSSIEEITGLFDLADRFLKDSSVELISLDARLQMAYNASLVFCSIALRASGYRIPTTPGHHEKTINSLRFTLNPKQKLIDTLNSFRKKRSRVTYDSVGTTSEGEVNEIYNIAIDLRDSVRKWLKKNHQDLIAKKE